MTQSIEITTAFPGGNAYILSCEGSRIDFMPSPRGGPEAMWFDFRATPPPASATLRCRLHLPDNLLGGRADTAGIAPVCRTSSRAWTRITQLELTTREDGRPILEWDVPADDGPVEVALSYPYGQAELDKFLAETPWRQDVIGLSDADRPLMRLANTYGDVDASRSGLYCTARQHAGEAPGSWVLDGLLREIAVAGSSAPLVWAVPFVDIDGVYEGRFGKDSYPCDYNRSWGSKLFPEDDQRTMGTHPMRHVVRNIQTDMQHWQTRCVPALAIDFHAPVLHEGGGIYCYVRDVDSAGHADAAHLPWIEAIRHAMPDEYASDVFIRSSRYPSRWNAARASDFAVRALGVPQLSIETPYAYAGDRLFTREDYRSAGRAIARGIVNRINQSTSPKKGSS